MQSDTEYSKEYEKTITFVGTGSFGRVYLVIHKATSQTYAAKYLNYETKRQKALAEKEFSFLSSLDHNNIIKMINAYTLESKCVLIMEYHSGGTLQTKVRTHILTEDEAVVILRQICDGLEYLHSKYIAHCDLKSDNIVFDEPGSVHVKIIDFGMAHVLPEPQKLPMIYGAIHYTAPEMLLYQPVTVLVDMWSLGVMTYFIYECRKVRVKDK